VHLDERADPGVRRAAESLRDDIGRVTGSRPRLVTGQATSGGREIVIIGTVGQSPMIAELVNAGRLDVSAIRGRWEASITEVVPQPWPGVERALVIAGSDKRGTIYGVYDLSEQIGVSPWYWWADVPVRQRDSVYVLPGRHVRNEPVVKYRGIFLNDEAPALAGWAGEKFGGFNHTFYERVFELILRLRGNFLWPAMWGSAFNDDDPLNPELANEYGIVMGTSHHEPMMRAHAEWARYGEGPWSYDKNSRVLERFWRDGARRTGDFEQVITLGMRGDGDEPMSEEANVALLERIVAKQREIIAAEISPDIASVPQVWALYKEVQEYYERGMRVPDDVTLLWCDDNWGNIRRLPTAEERSRPGGAGVYYHFDYVGGPRSYKWLNITPLPKIWEQMHLAWRYGATRLWIVNVGDLKPMEYPIQFFLDYAWDPGRWTVDNLPDYGRLWAEREFGPEHAIDIADLVAKYTKYNRRRSPELLGPETYSLVDYREAETVVADYRAIERRAEAIYQQLPEMARDAFFQLVLHPIRAGAILNDLYVTSGFNRLHAAQGRASANASAERVRELFRDDAGLTRYYHEELAGGKWNHFMSQLHIGYTYWNQPVRNTMPPVQEIQVTPQAEMGVAVEGAARSWPDLGPVQPMLPALNVFDRQPRWFEVYNRGEAPFDFEVSISDPWLEVDVSRGTIGADQRIWVSARWDRAPLGVTAGTVRISGSEGSEVAVQVPIFNPPELRPENVDGFVETNGYISIEAAHFSRAVAPAGREWQVIPDHGRSLSGVTPAPAPAPELEPDSNGMWLEYRLYVFTPGTVTVTLQLAPTLKFQPGDGFQFAVSFDDEQPRRLDAHADPSLQAWERMVADGVNSVTSAHEIATRGEHVLRYRVIDPGLVLHKIVVDTGGVRPSYLGPPESFHRLAVPAASRP
jgi:hypothetical protein